MTEEFPARQKSKAGIFAVVLTFSLVGFTTIVQTVIVQSETGFNISYLTIKSYFFLLT